MKLEARCFNDVSSSSRAKEEDGMDWLQHCSSFWRTKTKYIQLV